MKWGDRLIESRVPTREPKEIPVGGLRREVPLLPKIAALAERGSLQLFRSDVASGESLDHSGDFQPSHTGHVFERVRFTKIRSGFDSVIAIASRTLPQMDSAESQLKAFFASHGDPELREMVRLFGRTNSIDALHLLTASRHNLDFFLCDCKFARTYGNYVRTAKKSCFRTRAVTPSELLRLISGRNE